MPASKIVNVDEARRWISEGRPYSWIIETYRDKYGVESTPAMWSNFRRRQGLEARHVRDENLIPWRIEEPHRGAYLLEMLRYEARRRAGNQMRPIEERRLASFRQNLANTDAVVHYEPESDVGFHYVPRREGIDQDLIREPARKTKMTRRPQPEGAGS